MKKIISLLCVVAMSICVFTACGGPNPSNKDVTILQMQEINEDNPIVTITVEKFGDIVIELFPEEAPKTVENFITLAKDGYYDGLTFHRVIEDFMIQGGDPTATGKGGESIWGKDFEDEFSDNLYCFNGALCMANSGANTNGSQFFIVQTNKTADSTYLTQAAYSNKSESDGYGRQSWSDEVAAVYAEVGGTPWLDYRHTVFGQVREGLNLVNKIEVVDVVDENTSKPVNDVIIEKITVKE